MNRGQAREPASDVERLREVASDPEIAGRALKGFDVGASDTAFALLVICAPEHAAETEHTFHEHGATSCHAA